MRPCGRKAIALLLVAVLSLALAQPVAASWYALLVGAQGQDQAVFDNDVVTVNAALTSGRWNGYNLPGHTLTLRSGGVLQAGSANVIASLGSLNALMATDTDAVKYLLVYFAGHA